MRATREAQSAHGELVRLDDRLGHPAGHPEAAVALPPVPGPDRDDARQPPRAVPAGRAAGAGAERVPGRHHTRGDRGIPRSRTPTSARHPRRAHRGAPCDGREPRPRSPGRARTGALVALHAAVARQLDELARTPDPTRLYAVPYAVAYADAAGARASATSMRRRRGRTGRRGTRALPAQPRARPAHERLRERRCGVGHRPVPAPQRADRRVRDLRRRAVRREGVPRASAC